MWHAISSLLKAISIRRSQRKENSRRKNLGHARSGITIVAVLRTVSDRTLLDELSRRNQWNLCYVPSSDEAHAALQRNKPQIILVDRDVVAPDWRFAVSSLSTASGGACVLLISTVIDDYLWNEVITNGGYDVVRKPLIEEDVLRNVKLAWAYWYGTRRTAARK